ncbi:hypothetical protein ABZ769_17725 [Streptomyces olivoreticuli]
MLIALMYPGALSVTRVGGPSTVPTESRVCSACVRLDSAKRAALIRGDAVAHADFSEALVIHWRKAHPKHPVSPVRA